MKKIINFTLMLILMCTFCSFNCINAAELIDNGAKISSSTIIQTKTGTGPFDDNDEPGNDSSEENSVVRSFDQIMWTIENTMVVTGEESSFSGGKIYFEAEYPECLNSETAEWDLDSMAWIENVTISADKRKISGYYSMSTENITIPGKQSLVFVLNIYGAANGTEFQPTFKMWLNGNEEKDYVNVIPENIRVSAAPKYNIKLVRNESCAIRTTVNIDGNNVTGRMYGYAIIYQLYNDSVSKGLKGVEYPTGEIDLDLQMGLTKKESNSSVQTDITSEVTPILWNYQIALAGYNNTMIPGRNMFTGSSTFVYNGNQLMPAGKATSNRNSSVYNSGNISIVQEGSVLKTKLTNYKFDGKFPSYNSGYIAGSAINYSANIGCFGSIYLQILVPDWDEYDTQTDYYFSLKNINFNATSISGLTTTTQMNTSDDSTNVQYVKLLPGSYNSLVYIHKRTDKASTGTVHTLWNTGDGRVQRGQSLFLRAQIEQSVNNDDEVHMRTVNDFMKFDADCYKPVILSDGTRFKPANTKMTFKMWYVTKSDGTNWISQTEMNTTLIEDCILYESLEDIPEGDLCIGVYYESQGGVLPDRDFYIDLPVVVKDTAMIGQTYAVTQTPVYWIYALDRSVYTALNENVEWPTDSVYHPVRNYVKTEYDSSGTQISGTHAGGTYYGNTVQVVGATQSIKLSTVDTRSNTTKINYDISKNEYEVTYKIEPTISSSGTNINISGVTIQIMVTLPSGLTYVPGSCAIGEPEITTNTNGESTLVWNLNDCIVNKEIDPVLFNVHIDENTLNGVQYETKVVMLADSSKVGTTKLSERTATTSIQIVNLSSHRFFKATDTSVIEKNGTIHYTLSYKNNTDSSIQDFQLLDILPYNGDNRGTEFNGTYTLDRIVVVQEDSSGNVVNNDNITILYTNEPSARNTSPKDENLASNWSVVNVENIKSAATALAIKGDIGAQGKLTIDIYLKTNNNKSLDKYVNNATAQVYTETEEITTSNVTAQVVKRKIEGVAWFDSNANGLIDEGEELLKDIEITLTDSQGNTVTDINGNKLATVWTDENGYYSFEDLPADNYYITTQTLDNTYTLTAKEVGANSEINSKFNIDSKQSDLITKLNSIDLPELTVSNVNVGFVKKETKVIVNYKEIDTNKILHEEVTINGRIDDEYNTENKIDEINSSNNNKYEYIKVDGNITATMTENTIYVTYWYQKKAANVKVLHVLEGTDVSNPETVIDVLYPTEEINGRVDDTYSTQNKLEEINNASKVQYDLVTDEVVNKNGNMTLDTIYVVYEYRKAPATIKIEHKDIDTKEELIESEKTNGIVGEDYSTANKLKEINEAYQNKYELVTPEPDNKNGEYKREEQTITYYYKKKIGQIEVNYLEVETNKILATQVKTQGQVDSEYTTVSKLDEINEENENKYEFVETTGAATEGVYQVDKQIINYWYQKKQGEIEVNYLEVGTNKVLATQVKTQGQVDSEYTTVSKLDEINEENGNKYEFVETTGAAIEGVYQVDKQVINYWYQKKATKVIAKYVDINSKEEIYEEDIQKGRIDDEYVTVNEIDNINVKYNNIYEFVESTDNTEGNMTEKVIEVIYYYQKKATNIKVLHVLEGTDVSNPETIIDVLYPTEEINGRVDDTYSTQNKLEEINNTSKVQYDLVTDEVVNKNGNMTLDTIYVIYEYRKAPATIKIEHKDIDTNDDLLLVVTENGIVGENYSTTNKLEEINGIYENKYELVIPEPYNKDGEYKREEKTITYYYSKKSANVVVKYVDIDTEEELIEGEEIKGKVDEEYETEDKIEEINEELTNKYILVKTTENTIGKMELETIEVVYYYKKVEAQVIVKHIDEETGEEIETREYLGGYVGDEYTTNPKEIEGYELVEKRIPENKDGKYTEETIEVIYYYNKLQSSEESVETSDINLLFIISLLVISSCVITILKKVKNSLN